MPVHESYVYAAGWNPFSHWSCPISWAWCICTPEYLSHPHSEMLLSCPLSLYTFLPSDTGISYTCVLPDPAMPHKRKDPWHCVHEAFRHWSRTDRSFSSSKTGYYLDAETARLAQEMYEDKDMRSLFDMKRNMPPERFKAHLDFMKNLYDQEKAQEK